MQSLAAELNLSETAFLRPLGRGRFRLRWFTPTVEVPLCGHATLASAHVLFREAGQGSRELLFETRSGTLSAVRTGGLIRLDFPEHHPRPARAPRGLLAAMGIRRVEDAARAEGGLILRLPRSADIRKVRPDFGRMRELRLGMGGVLVTRRGRRPYDFVSRCFFPWHGIDEDPVTGSAHCSLVPYWSRILGGDRFRAFQASERGGELRLERRAGRVLLSGKAFTVTRGKIRYPC